MLHFDLVPLPEAPALSFAAQYWWLLALIAAAVAAGVVLAVRAIRKNKAGERK